jgi:hypothetical protein
VCVVCVSSAATRHAIHGRYIVDVSRGEGGGGEVYQRYNWSFWCIIFLYHLYHRYACMLVGWSVCLIHVSLLNVLIQTQRGRTMYRYTVRPRMFGWVMLGLVLCHSQPLLPTCCVPCPSAL